MIPLVFCFFAPFAFDQFTLPKIALAAALVLAAGWREGFCKKHLTWSLLLLFAVFCASAALSGDFLVNLTGRYLARWLGLIPLAVCLLAYHLPARRAADLDRQMRLAAAVLSVHGLSQLVWNPMGYEVLSTGHRISGAAGSPPTLGCLLAMCLPFCYGRTPARAILTALTMAALLATGSRGPLLAAAVSAAVIGWPDRQDRLGARLAAVLLALGAVLALFNHGTSDQIRLLTWTSALKVWWAHPWLGCGAESYVDAWRAFRNTEWITVSGAAHFQDHAHNDFLEVLAAAGVVGFAAYCLFLRRAWGQLSRWGDRPAIASIVALFVCAKFNAVPFPALFAAALLLGSLDWWVTILPVPAHRWELRAVAGVLVVLTVWGVAADVVFYRARRVLDFPGIMRAVTMNPLELAYRSHEADLLTRKWDADGKTDPELLYNALDISWRSLHLHPGSVQARHMVTQNLILLARTDPRFIAPAQKSAATLMSRDPMLNFKFRVVVK